MRNICYLLSVRELWEPTEGRSRMEEALLRVDAGRRKRAERMRIGSAQAACVGAGLLLQLAAREARGERMGSGLCRIAVSQVLELPPAPIDFRIDYGEKGKPYLRDYPFYFNLSHSGEYVACAVSDSEVGVDIQRCSPADGECLGRLARRFFSEEERRALEQCGDGEERRRLFYRLWTRKEAYGKLTGQGIVPVLERCVLPPAYPAEPDGAVVWQEWAFPGYQMALCRYGEGRQESRTGKKGSGI